MGFLLPVAFFLVFAAIFGGATGQQMSLRIAIADEQASPESVRLIRALREEPSLREVGATAADADEVRSRVRSGAADVGLVVRRDGASLDRTESVIRRMSEIGLNQPGVKDAVAFPGLSISGFSVAPNAGIVFFGLKSFEERRDPNLTGPAIAGALNGKFASIRDAFVLAVPPPPVPACWCWPPRRW